MADLSALLEEVSADKPCGDYLEYDPAYLELNKDILGTPEDPISGEAAQPPNWRDIEKKSLAILQQSKDLQIAIYLLRALIVQEGIPGFRDGLNFLRGLLENYWESVHPQLDPDDDLDPTARINILEELNSFESVLRPLSLASLVESKSVGQFSLRDIQLATDKIEVAEGVSKPDINLIKNLFLDTKQTQTPLTYQAVIECVDLIQQIDRFVGEQVGIENSADFSALLAQLKETRHVFEQFAVGLGHDTDAESVNEGDFDDSGAVQPARKQLNVGEINSRQDVLRMLDLICKYYKDVEPTSPVPMLLNRAKYLVTADFMQIIQNLLPDGLTQLEQIKGPDPEADSENNY
jgi:type VI secretion system protein ImpA